MRQTIIAVLFVLISASAASAEWGLYVSRNGSPWKLERSYAFKGVVENSCERSARELWRAEGQGKGNVTGVACQEYAALNYSPTLRAREHAAAAAAVDSRQEARELLIGKDAARQYPVPGSFADDRASKIARDEYRRAEMEAARTEAIARSLAVPRR